MISHRPLTDGNGRRVLITRPEPAATTSGGSLAQAGFHPVLLPLTQTKALDFNRDSADYTAVTVTSANALRHVDALFLAQFHDLPLFAVGEGTAQAAVEAGFNNVIEGGGDAERLAMKLSQNVAPGASLLYLAGRVRQPLFENRVAQLGLTMRVIDVYDTVVLTYQPAELEHILAGPTFSAILLYSGAAAGNLARYADRLAPWLDARTQFFCISARVAANLPFAWRMQAVIASHPDEAGLFQLFERI